MTRGAHCGATSAGQKPALAAAAGWPETTARPLSLLLSDFLEATWCTLPLHAPSCRLISNNGRSALCTDVAEAGMDLAELPTLVQRLRRGGRVQQLQAANALRGLAWRDPEARAAVCAAGAVPMLVQCLSRSGSSDALLTAVLGALESLASDANISSTAVQDLASCIPTAVRLLQHSSSSVQHQAAHMLGCYANRGEEHAAAAAAAGCIEPLLQQLSSADELAAGSAAFALAVQAGNASSLGRRVQDLLAAKAPDIARLLRSNRCDVQLLAATAALLVAYDERAVPSLLAAGGVEALTRMCSSDVRHQQPAAQALAGLAHHSGSGPSLIAAAGATAAVQQALRCASSNTNLPQEARWSMQALGDALTGLPSPSAAATTPPPAQPAAPPRVCAAQGCTNTQHLRRCGGCGAVRYCSKACSKAHWRAHRAECRRLQKEAAARADEAAAGEAAAGAARP